MTSECFSFYRLRDSFLFAAQVIVPGSGIVVRAEQGTDSQNIHTNIPLLVGYKNHRQFILFVSTLVMGIVLFDYLSFACG